MARTRIIGIGHHDRGDDAVGRVVAARLRAEAPPDVEVIETDGDATQLLDLFDGVDGVIVIDAALSGNAPGSIHRLDVVFAPVPRPLFATSSHAVGLAESIELARVLGSLPKRCVVFAVEGERFDLGAPLSAPVAEAVARVVAGVLHEMRVEAG